MERIQKWVLAFGLVLLTGSVMPIQAEESEPVRQLSLRRYGPVSQSFAPRPGRLVPAMTVDRAVLTVRIPNEATAPIQSSSIQTDVSRSANGVLHRDAVNALVGGPVEIASLSQIQSGVGEEFVAGNPEPTEGERFAVADRSATIELKEPAWTDPSTPMQGDSEFPVAGVAEDSEFEIVVPDEEARSGGPDSWLEAATVSYHPIDLVAEHEALVTYAALQAEGTAAVLARFDPLQVQHQFVHRVSYAPLQAAVIRNPQAFYSALEVEDTHRLLQPVPYSDPYDKGKGYRINWSRPDITSIRALTPRVHVRPSYHIPRSYRGYLVSTEPMRLRAFAGRPAVDRNIPVPWTKDMTRRKRQSPDEIGLMGEDGVPVEAAKLELPSMQAGKPLPPEIVEEIAEGAAELEVDIAPAEYLGNVDLLTDEILYYFEKPTDESSRKESVVVPFVLPYESGVRPLEHRESSRSEATYELIP